VLVLIRKIGESIQIGGEVTVTLLAVKGKSIRLGIDAPTATRVIRAELLDVRAVTDAEAITPSDAQELADWIRWEGNHGNA